MGIEREKGTDTHTHRHREREREREKRYGVQVGWEPMYMQIPR